MEDLPLCAQLDDAVEPARGGVPLRTECGGVAEMKNDSEVPPLVFTSAEETRVFDQLGIRRLSGTIWACQTPDDMRAWLIADVRTTKLAFLADDPGFNAVRLLHCSAAEVVELINDIKKRTGHSAPPGQTFSLTNMRLVGEGHRFYRIAATQIVQHPRCPLCEDLEFIRVLGKGSFGVAWEVIVVVVCFLSPA